MSLPPQWSPSRWLCLIAALAGLLLAAGCGAAGPAEVAAPTVQCTVVQRSGGLGGLSYSGRVQAVRQVSVAPMVAGRVARVLVQVGSAVQAGDALVELDREALAAQVSQAESALAMAQARLDAIRAGPRVEVVTQAEVTLSMAQRQLAALERGGRAELVGQAEADLASARAVLQQVRKGATPQEIAIARLAIDQAKNALWGAQASRDGICGNKSGSNAACDGAKAQVASGETAVQQAEMRLAQLQTGASAETIAQAEAAVRASEEQLKLARQPASADDLAQARDQVRLAEAQLALAKAPYTAYDIAAAEAAVAQAQAAADLAGLGLAEATVRAPIDGLVAERLASEGSLASSATPLLVLISPATEVLVQVDESALAALQVGLAATITGEAYPGAVFAARVAAIAPAVDAPSGAVTVQLAPEDPQGLLHDGMLVRVTLAPPGQQGALMVPASAVRQEGDGPVVYVLRGGKAERCPVTTLAANGDQLAVSDGLSEGDRVIIDPTDLHDGQIVVAE